jgi:hypothetical protein
MNIQNWGSTFSTAALSNLSLEDLRILRDIVGTGFALQFLNGRHASLQFFRKAFSKPVF